MGGKKSLGGTGGAGGSRGGIFGGLSPSSGDDLPLPVESSTLFDWLKYELLCGIALDFASGLPGNNQPRPLFLFALSGYLTTLGVLRSLSLYWRGCVLIILVNVLLKLFV